MSRNAGFQGALPAAVRMNRPDIAGLLLELGDGLENLGDDPADRLMRPGHGWVARRKGQHRQLRGDAGCAVADARRSGEASGGAGHAA